jgi:hypothetical protein
LWRLVNVSGVATKSSAGFLAAVVVDEDPEEEEEPELQAATRARASGARMRAMRMRRVMRGLYAAPLPIRCAR